MFKRIADETGIPLGKVQNTVSLLDDDKTIPFIARYRKEVTGELDEVEIRKIEERLRYYRNLEEKKADVLRLIDEQGKLTDELKAKILAVRRLTDLEDLYRPYRLKRKTRASVARERGLQGLADFLWSFPGEEFLFAETEKYLGDDVPTVEDALQGARDIIAEQVADDPEVRQKVREMMRRRGLIRSRGRDTEQESVYSLYYDFQEPVNRIPPHRILAINRGEKEEFLKAGVEMESDLVIDWLTQRLVQDGTSSDQVSEAIRDAYRRLLFPAVERDIRSELTDKAQEQALQVFSQNLRRLLLQPPVWGKIILGIDPGYRTGCKWAVVDSTGQVLDIGVFYPTPPRRDVQGTMKTLKRLLKEHRINAIAIGNGTGSRETEQVVADFIRNSDDPLLVYTIVSEAGASVYSASPLAAQEFPELDVSERSAISIARRVIDPLAELVKIEPRSCGVGQYQHDIPSKRLDESLCGVVESAVNHVGVDLNTASPSLLSYVAGLSGTVAANIVKRREEAGPFQDRRQLLKVPRLGPKAFEQAAGFLRIPRGKNPLDATPIHPESYDLTERLLSYIGEEMSQVGSDSLLRKLEGLDINLVARELGVGLPTLRDIIEALTRPGRDPREDVPPPVFRQDVLSMDSLLMGMEFQGVVRNVVDFGVFVDIGVKVDGLVHISEMSERRIKHPMELVSVGDIINVQVILVDKEKNRVSLSMKKAGTSV
ncbi:MAG: RNA-binding transcriptional accessory protein [Syntrophomonadaceae bacterium]|nr:RNA-binding transcriptional accessory protein [Syntrophomonadaceae bacterium]